MPFVEFEQRNFIAAVFLYTNVFWWQCLGKQSNGAYNIFEHGTSVVELILSSLKSTSNINVEIDNLGTSGRDEEEGGASREADE